MSEVNVNPPRRKTSSWAPNYLCNFIHNARHSNESSQPNKKTKMTENQEGKWTRGIDPQEVPDFNIITLD